MVSVFMITYNHENFIVQAIEGVLMQKTNFPIEIVIGEDCSTDGTRKILLEYQAKFPKTIKLNLHHENVGMHANFISTYKMCKNKYVAYCEGDDYWTDESKLQKQADYMEANEICVLCFHDAFKYIDTEKRILEKPIVNRVVGFNVSTLDLLHRNPIPTLTILFKNNMIKEFPDWFKKVGGADRPLHLILSNYGDINYLPFIGAVYRIHSESVTQKSKSKGVSARIKLLERRHKVYDYYNEFFGNKFDSEIAIIKKEVFVELFNLNFFQGSKKIAKILVRENVVDYNDMKSVKMKYKYLTVKALIFLDSNK